MSREFLVWHILLFMIILWEPFSYGLDDGDFQYWNTETISCKLDEDVTITLEEEFRFADDAGDFVYQHSDLGLEYFGIADWLVLGANYRHIFEKSGGEWVENNEPHLNATIKWKAVGLSFSNRVRLVYRNRETGEDGWIYRNKFALKPLKKFTKLSIQPYIADEIFIDFDDNRFTRNRLYTGFELPLSENIKAGLFYLWQTSKSRGTWIDCNVLGTNLKISF
jgi:hypothetical protein